MVLATENISLVLVNMDIIGMVHVVSLVVILLMFGTVRTAFVLLLIINLVQEAMKPVAAEIAVMDCMHHVTA